MWEINSELICCKTSLEIYVLLAFLQLLELNLPPYIGIQRYRTYVAGSEIDLDNKI